MKREGRQHGMVRTRCPAQPNLDRLLKSSSSPPIVVGTFTPTPPKPTANHSKYIGRCGTRHSGKSKDNNIKGSHKLRWHDAVSNHGVAARWAEEGSRFHSGYYYGGVSVAGLLEKLAIDVDRDDGDYQDDDQDCENP